MARSGHRADSADTHRNPGRAGRCCITSCPTSPWTSTLIAVVFISFSLLFGLHFSIPPFIPQPANQGARLRGLLVPTLIVWGAFTPPVICCPTVP